MKVSPDWPPAKPGLFAHTLRNDLARGDGDERPRCRPRCRPMERHLAQRQVEELQHALLAAAVPGRAESGGQRVVGRDFRPCGSGHGLALGHGEGIVDDGAAPKLPAAVVAVRARNPPPKKGPCAMVSTRSGRFPRRARSGVRPCRPPGSGPIAARPRRDGFGDGEAAGAIKRRNRPAVVVCRSVPGRCRPDRPSGASGDRRCGAGGRRRR